MIQKPLDVLHHYPVRKSKRQKSAFRREVMEYIRSLGYDPWEEKGSLGARNVVFGNQEGAKYLVTAHYDTCPELPFPNFITPCNLGIYLLYQLALVMGMFAVMGAVYLLVIVLGGSGSLPFSISYLSMLAMLYLMMFGPANKTNANDNTSGVVTVLEIAAALPEEARQQVCFVLFDLEEVGLVGSASYRSSHKKITQKQLVMNLDCVGDGDELVLFPCGRIKKDPQLMQLLASVSRTAGSKRLWVHEKGFSMYPSDQANFPLGVGIAALHRHKHIGLYMDKIHTRKDRVLEEENVTLVRDTLVDIITK